MELNKNNNNITIYYNQANGQFIKVDEYEKLTKQKPLPLKKLKNILPIAPNDKYYIFFKKRIEKELQEQ